MKIHPVEVVVLKLEKTIMSWVTDDQLRSARRVLRRFDTIYKSPLSDYLWQLESDRFNYLYERDFGNGLIETT